MWCKKFLRFCISCWEAVEVDISFAVTFISSSAFIIDKVSPYFLIRNHKDACNFISHYTVIANLTREVVVISFSDTCLQTIIQFFYCLEHKCKLFLIFRTKSLWNYSVESRNLIVKLKIVLYSCTDYKIISILCFISSKILWNNLVITPIKIHFKPIDTLGNWHHYRQKNDQSTSTHITFILKVFNTCSYPKQIMMRAAVKLAQADCALIIDLTKHSCSASLPEEFYKKKLKEEQLDSEEERSWIGA